VIITINNQKSINQLQDEFNELFPFLKLEFFYSISKSVPITSNIKPDATSITIGDLRKSTIEGHINIAHGMTVSSLELQLSNEFGLQVRILRKAGNLWMETPLTEGWTLDEQNKQGEILKSMMG
jgi:hypothetical protein